jgi:hypothetical protein
LKAALSECESSGIDVLGIGIGIAPLNLRKLFPVALYCPDINDLGKGLAISMEVSGRLNSSPITPREIFCIPEGNFHDVMDLLCGYAKLCPALRNSIADQPLSLDFMESVGDTDLIYMKGAAENLTVNPEEEPFHDGAFIGFDVLVVCLYLGSNGVDDMVTRAVFDAQCGAALKRKGFEYTFVCSYGEGLSELLKEKNGYCPYSQLWLFPSAGLGVLPSEARDKDTNKILPFLKAVADFWRNGGGLLLFCDNEPFDFETNYLLKNLLSFPRHGRMQTSAVRFSGSYLGTRHLHVAPSDVPIAGGFSRKCRLPPPGRATVRCSLRPGLIRIYEGVTIANAVNDLNSPLTDEASVWPFTPFAWTSENVSPPRPYILYYDPVIERGAEKSPGPIVLHGGDTCAFYEFGTDERGTGRLIVSICCWLTRMEERMYISKLESRPLIPFTPKLSRNYSVQCNFTGWRR